MPVLSPDKSTPDITEEQQNTLLAIARASIECGLQTGRPNPSGMMSEDRMLNRPAACFVTLERDGQLRGCMGSLEASKPLQQAVAEMAFAAAFRDPRFPPMTPQEWLTVHLSISLLTQATGLTVRSEVELIAQLRPAVDGVIIEQHGHRATFLPQVWEHFPDNAPGFLQALRQKAGLPKSFDANALYSVYQVQYFS